MARTEPRSPIEEQLLRTIARLDGRLWKGTDDERQERDAEVIMRTVVAPALEQVRRDAIEEVAAAIEAKAAPVENFALRAVVAEGANIARALTSEES